MQFAAAFDTASIVKLETGNDPIVNDTQPAGDALNEKGPETAGLTAMVVPDERAITSGAWAELAGKRTNAALEGAATVAVALGAAVTVAIGDGAGGIPPPPLHATIANMIEVHHIPRNRTAHPSLFSSEKLLVSLHS